MRGNILTVSGSARLISESRERENCNLDTRGRRKKSPSARTGASDYKHKLLGTFVRVKEPGPSHSITGISRTRTARSFSDVCVRD